MIRTALLLALLAGCRAADPCAGHEGTCIALQIEGEPSLALDQLGYQLTQESAQPPLVFHGAAEGTRSRVTLPTRTAIFLPAQAIGKFTLEVTGFASGQELAHGKTPPIEIALGAHVSATLTLLGSGRDGGIPDGANGASGDAAELPGGKDGETDGAYTPKDFAGIDLGLPHGCEPGQLFCDDFEKNFDRWDTQMPQGDTDTVELSTKQKIYNNSALRAYHQKGKLNSRYLETTFSPEISDGILTVRAYLYSSYSLTDYLAIFRFLLSTGEEVRIVEGNNSDVVDGGGGSYGYWASTYVNGKGEDNYAWGPYIPPAQWSCVEIALNYETRRIQLYVTDAMAPDHKAKPVIDYVAAASLGPAEKFDIGLVESSANISVELFFDDLAIAHFPKNSPQTRIGCEPYP